MKLKLPPDNYGICTSCRNSTFIQFDGGQKYIKCGAVDEVIRSKVSECSDYNNRALPSLYDMKSTAWILESDERKKTIGFITNKEWRKSHKHEEVVDEY